MIYAYFIYECKACDSILACRLQLACRYWSVYNYLHITILQEVYVALLERYEKALTCLASVKPFLENNGYGNYE